jgi:hypothetical protein
MLYDQGLTKAPTSGDQMQNGDSAMKKLIRVPFFGDSNLQHLK